MTPRSRCHVRRLAGVITDMEEMDREVGVDHGCTLAGAVGAALVEALGQLPAQHRLAFVLHDLLGLPLGEVARVVGRDPAATRRMTDAARRHVRAGRDGAPRIASVAQAGDIPTGDEGLTREQRYRS